MAVKTELTPEEVEKVSRVTGLPPRVLSNNVLTARLLVLLNCLSRRSSRTKNGLDEFKEIVDVISDVL